MSIKNLPSILTLAVKFFRRLFADSTMLTRIGSTPVKHKTWFQGNIIRWWELLIFPVSGQFIVAINGDVPHAANEAFCSIDASTDHVVWPGGKFKNPPVVNLTNIFKQLLRQLPWTKKKWWSQTVIRENLCKTLSY